MSVNDITSGSFQLPEVLVTADKKKKESNISSMISPSDYPTPKVGSQEKYEKSGRGFYYDDQINNKLISVTLHPNTVTFDGGITWLPASKKGDVDYDGYLIEPLCKSILKEDYQVATSNTWSEFGNDSIGNFFNSLKPYAPYTEHLNQMLDKANKKEEELKNSNNPEDKKVMNSSFSKTMDEFTSFLGRTLKESPKLLNRTLISQGGRFSYYSGTGVGFGNLSMNFTLFPSWNEDGTLLNINDQLNKIYPYCFGKYVKTLDEDGNITGTDIKTSNIKFINKHRDDINRVFGWQLPPGGYISSVKDIDEIQFGTLKLKFGAFYSLDNLVCENIQMQFSKQMMKFWDKNNKMTTITPLYCNVSLSLRPAVKFTDEKLKEFVSGVNMSDDRERYENFMYMKLKEEIDNNNENLGKY